jgi:alanine dehydrogenase
MKILDARTVAAALPYPALVGGLREAFRHGESPPSRHHHPLPSTGTAGTLLLMPAWSPPGAPEPRYVALKVVTVFTENGALGLPAVMGSVLLFSATTGEPLAMMEGGELTARRTAAASALAASYLARPDADTMLMVGTGRMAPHLVRAHRGVRPLSRVLVWGRSPEKAREVVRQLEEDPGPGPLLEVSAVDSLPEAVPAADLISCATLSTEPLVLGKWLRPGSHLDLVGAYTPTMRECDAEAVRRSTVWVDTREGAAAEAGDLLQAAAEGAFSPDSIRGDLFQLCRGEVAGRLDPGEITLFKSVGTAIEDLAAARLALAAATSAPPE